VCWQSWIETSGEISPGYSKAGAHIEWPQGIMASGQCIETNMIVPAKCGNGWRAVIDFRVITPQESEKIKAQTREFKGVSEYEWCPHDKKWKSSKDEWHH